MTDDFEDYDFDEDFVEEADSSAMVSSDELTDSEHLAEENGLPRFVYSKSENRIKPMPVYITIVTKVRKDKSLINGHNLLIIPKWQSVLKKDENPSRGKKEIRDEEASEVLYRAFYEVSNRKIRNFINDKVGEEHVEKRKELLKKEGIPFTHDSLINTMDECVITGNQYFDLRKLFVSYRSCDFFEKIDFTTHEGRDIAYRGQPFEYVVSPVTVGGEKLYFVMYEVTFEKGYDKNGEEYIGLKSSRSRIYRKRKSILSKEKTDGTDA